MDSADYLVIESTYGNRLHEISGPVDMRARAGRGAPAHAGPKAAMWSSRPLRWAAPRRCSTLLREIKERGLVHGHDGFPVYVDSPLANEATAIFLQCDTVLL